MGKKKSGVLVSQGPVIPSATPMIGVDMAKPGADVTTVGLTTDLALENKTAASSSDPIKPSSFCFYLRQIDNAKLYSDEELRKIFLKVAYDQRHATQRLISGMYQRAQKERKADQVERSRLLQALFDSGQLRLAIEQGAI